MWPAKPDQEDQCHPYESNRKESKYLPSSSTGGQSKPILKILIYILKDLFIENKVLNGSPVTYSEH